VEQAIEKSRVAEGFQETLLEREFRNVCRAFMAFREFEGELYQLEEDFDESVKYYDTATWINFTANPDKADLLSKKAINGIRHAAGRMEDASNIAFDNLTKLLKRALGSSQRMQNRIFGRAYSLSKAEMKEFIDHELDDQFLEEDFPEHGEWYEYFIMAINERLARYLKVEEESFVRIANWKGSKKRRRHP
jgi:hypothetical protein